MTSVLIVEDDAQLRSAVVRDLAHRGYEVTSATSVDDALQRFDGGRFDVVLTDLRLGDRDGIDLLAVLSEIAPGTRPILMSAYATARDHQRAIQLGAVQVLCKPFTSTDLVQAIQQAIECAIGFRGSVHGLSLVDVLQMFHYGRRSISIVVGGNAGGEIHLKDGEIVHARRGDTEGDRALREILALPSGSIRTEALSEARVTIERSFQSLLLDVLCELDERERDGEVAASGPNEPEDTRPEGLARPARPKRHGLDEVCQRLRAEIDGAIACAIVDLHERTVRAAAAGDTDGNVGALAPCMAELFCCSSLGRLAAELSPEKARVNASRPVCQELRLTSIHGHTLAVTIDDGKAAVVLVTRPTANLPLAWAQLRAALPSIERGS